MSAELPEAIPEKIITPSTPTPEPLYDVPQPEATAAPEAPAEAPVETPAAPEEPPADLRTVELDRLDPIPEELKLSSGTVVAVQPLKARQFFRLLRIVTRGGAVMLPQFSLSMDMTEEAFVANLVGLVIVAIPEAEDEAIDFVRSMVDIKPDMSIANDKKALATARAELDMELVNPELEDVVSVIEAVILREATDLKSLGKRLQAMFKLAQRTGQTKSLPTGAPA